MKPNKSSIKLHLLSSVLLFQINNVNAQDMLPIDYSMRAEQALVIFVMIILIPILVILLALNRRFAGLKNEYSYRNNKTILEKLKNCTSKLNRTQIEKLLQQKGNVSSKAIIVFLLINLFCQYNAKGQAPTLPGGGSLMGESGVIITLVLILIPILAGLLIIVIKLSNAIHKEKINFKNWEADQLAEYLDGLSNEELKVLEERKSKLEFSLEDHELSGTHSPVDNRGLIKFHEENGLPVIPIKKKAPSRPNIDPALSRLILWYIGTATFWLLFGTTVGEYLGIKFIAPDVDQTSWLSFGRLRPIHTNAVFWGWASLSMIGLGYYIVPRVSNASLANIRWAWYSLWLINSAVLFGSISLMAGINNGGGEYREYVWPIMLLFAVGLAFTLINYLKTISKRKTEEVYISNWYIVAAVIFICIVALVGYLPYWQNGLGETIIQGYFMHQAVGMWFMLFTLGIVYYLLPQQLNKPIYSYSLGILAFWTQILFYTLIGTHHFVFSAIPWSLQTVAIVASVGMVIPVVAGTTNFIMTFNGAWYKIRDSYTLPFFLVGIVFYFTGSLQGTAEAFRFTNLLWHFTDFTVAHSHITMYGIITFFLWGAIYALLPRLTGKEAPQITIGIHFWLALIGLLFYSIPLMYGGSIRGLSWMEGQPFLESVKLMMPFWLWRAIGGTLMWLSHLFFAFNYYKMVNKNTVINIGDIAIKKIASQSGKSLY